MRDTLTSEGLVYCDWRVDVWDCVDSSFFFAATISLLCIRAIVFLGSIAILIFRFGIRGDKMGMANGVVVCYFVALAFHLIAAIVVLARASYLVRELFWSLVYPLGFMSMSLYLDAMIEAMPPISEVKLPSGKIRLMLLWSFLFFIITTQGVLFGVIGYFEDTGGSVDALFEAAFTLMAIQVAFFGIILTYYGVAFVNVLSKTLEQLKKMELQNNEAGRVRHFDLTVVIAKIKRQVRMFIYSIVFVIVLYLLFAFYDNFFVNIVFSKVMICIVNLTESLGIALISVIFFADIQRRVHEKQKGLTSSSSVSNEKEINKRIATLTVESKIEIA